MNFYLHKFNKSNHLLILSFYYDLKFNPKIYFKFRFISFHQICF